MIADCARDGQLDRSYSNSELRRARDNLPADLDEYSDCRDVIAAAIKGGSDKGLGSGSPGIGATDPAGEAAAPRGHFHDAADIVAHELALPGVESGTYLYSQVAYPGRDGLRAADGTARTIERR